MKTTRIQSVSRRMRTSMMMLLCVISLMLVSCKENRYSHVKGWEARESVLLKLCGTDEDYQQLMFRWLSEPEAVNYPFTQLQHDTPFWKTTSPDGKVTVFTWDSFEGGIVNKWNTVIHFECDGKPRLMACNLWDILEEREGSSALAVDGDDGDFGCVTTRIHQVKDVNGRTVYLAENHLYDARWCYSSINAFTIADGKLQPVSEMFVTPDRQIRDAIDYSYDTVTWHYRMEQFVGRKSVYGFTENNELLVPVDTDTIVEQSDLYERYVFNGSRFIHQDRVGGNGLHPSLQDFKEMVQLYRFGYHFLRVDQMNDDTYRLASWEVGDAQLEEVNAYMSLKPDTLIHGGTLDQTQGWYTFHDNDKEYRLNVLQAGEQNFVIRQGDKVIYSNRTRINP